MSDVIDLMTYRAKITLDDDDYNKKMDSAESKGNKFSSVVGGVGKSIGTAIAGGLAVAGTALAGFAVEGVKLASDLSEVQNVVDTTFGANTEAVNKWAKSAADSFGMSELAAKKYNGTMGAMLKSMGLTNDQVLNMSTSLTGLAGDFASFYNLDSEDAFNKIRAGISGETEPLKQLGINMSVANLEAYAMSQGLNKAYKEMTQAEQATLRYNYLLAVSADSQGDFAKTSDSLANQLRIAQLKVQDLSASFGSMLLPMVNNALSGILDFVNKSMPAFDNLFKGFTGLLNGTKGAEEQFANGASVIINELVESLASIIPKAVEILANLLPSVAEAIMTNLPKLIDEVMKILPQVAGTLLDMIPMFLDCGIKVILSLINGVTSAIPQLIPKIVSVVKSIATTLISNIPLIIDAAINLANGLFNGLVQAIPEIIAAVPQIITQLYDELQKQVPVIIQAGVELLTSLISALPSIIDQIVAAIPEIINAIVGYLNSAIPAIIQAGIDLLVSLVDALPDIVNSIVAAIPVIIDGIIKALVTAIPLLIQAGIDLFIALIKNLPVIITTIVQAIPKIIDSIVTALMDNIDEIILAGVQLFVALIANLPEIIIEIVKAIPQIIAAIVDAFGSFFETMGEVGFNLIKGIWEGIKDAGAWLWEKISGFCADIVTNIKNFFGIHSPSTVFAGIGEYMAEGLGIGFLDQMSLVAKDMTKAIPTDFNIGTNINAGSRSAGITGSVPIIFNYTAGDITIQGNADKTNVDLIRKISKEEAGNVMNEITRVFEQMPNLILQKSYSRV